VLGDPRLRHLERLDQLAHRTLALAQQVEDAAAAAVGQHVEDSH
jgi:hypothetical protein